MDVRKIYVFNKAEEISLELSDDELKLMIDELTWYLRNRECQNAEILIMEFKEGFRSVEDLFKFYGSKEKVINALKRFGIDLLDTDLEILESL